MRTPGVPAFAHLVPPGDCMGGLYGYATALGGHLISDSSLLGLPDGCRTLVLHFSPYGYHQNGVPESLVRQCEEWRHENPDHSLLVVFHELFARQPPWRKGFWLAPRQRRLLRRLIRCCNSGFSTISLYSCWLRRQGLEPFATVPVPSSVGETSTPLPLSQRLPQLIVFGGASQRQAAYKALRKQPWLLQALSIESIHDIGLPLINPPTSCADVPIESHGPLSVHEVASLVSVARYGLVSYPAKFLAKSSIFAAICAHGALPLVCDSGVSRQGVVDGLQSGVTFITPAWLQAHSGEARLDKQLATIAATAWSWYQPHRLREQIRLFQHWIHAFE